MRCFRVVGTSIWNPGYVCSIFWLGFVCRRVSGFSVWAFFVDVLDFVIVLFQSGVFRIHIFCVRVDVVTRLIFGWCSRLHCRVVWERCFRTRACVRVVVAIRVCFGWCSRLRYRVVSEWCLQIHISLPWLGGGGCCAYPQKRIDIRRENWLGGLKPKLRGTFGNFNVPPRGFCQGCLHAYLFLEINMQQPTSTTMGCRGIIIHL